MPAPRGLSVLAALRLATTRKSDWLQLVILQSPGFELLVGARPNVREVDEPLATSLASYGQGCLCLLSVPAATADRRTAFQPNILPVPVVAEFVNRPCHRSPNL